jgi:hypothetical protein
MSGNGNRFPMKPRKDKGAAGDPTNLGPFNAATKNRGIGLIS